MLNFTIPVLSGHLAIPREWPLNTGLTVNVIHQQNGARSSSGGFQDLSFAFQDWQYADKKHNWKEKVQSNAQLPFCGQTRAFRYEIVFRRIQPCFYTALTNQGSKDSEETWRFTLYSMVKELYVFKREFSYL